MKVNCKALKLSIIISITFMLLAIAFKVIDVNFENDVTTFLKDATIGVFCSSVVTIFFYSSAYNVEKKHTLERFWNECYKLLKELDKIEYMRLEFEKNVFIGFIHEKSSIWLNEYYKAMGRDLPEENVVNTNLMKLEIAKRNTDLFDKISQEAANKYVKDKLDRTYKKTLSDMEKIIEQYLNYLENSTDNLNFILGDIEFFSGKKCYMSAYCLYKMLYDLSIRIQETAIHFRYYKDGKGNTAVTLQKLLELQNHIFRVEQKENGNIVYSEFSDNMRLKLEDFRAKTIYNIKSEKIEIVPILQY